MYGGEQGILASSNDGIGYGYFVIDACHDWDTTLILSIGMPSPPMQFR